jgi:hypothetical protein
LSLIASIARPTNEFSAAQKAVGDPTGDGGKVSNHKEGFSHIVNPKWPRGGFKGRHASVNPNHSAECCAAVAAALDFF